MPPPTGHRLALGWESLTSEVRGHFLGHWLSATAHLGREDAGIATKARHVVSELGRCQQANGGEWVGSFPPRYLARISAGTFVWAPQYTLHKIIMGLLDQHVVAGNAQPLEIVNAFATWFLRWTDPMDRVQLDDLLDWETGGLLEVWADLYALTGKPEHLELMRRYDRPRFFDPLLAGHDVLTNKHANTQIRRSSVPLGPGRSPGSSDGVTSSRRSGTRRSPRAEPTAPAAAPVVRSGSRRTSCRPG